MLLAIDQGTTGTSCLVFDLEGELVGRAYREFSQHFPRPGWVEHDAAEIWTVSQAVAGEALDDAGVRPGELEAVGITNQRETVVVWDPSTGEPLHHALVWQDRRTAARCHELREAGHEPLVRERTGLVLDPYFSATKLEWLIRHGDVPAGSLPEPRPSAEVYGETREFGAPVPVAGIAGDQQAALYGQACHEPGLAKNTYGTGNFLLQDAGAREPLLERGLI